MFARKSVLSLVLPFLLNQAVAQSDDSQSDALQLDVNSADSIKLAAKSLAGGIVAAYNSALNESRIPGLFDDEIYFWEAGTVWNGLLGYSYLTGDSQYDDTISKALQWQVGDYNAFMPPNQTRSIGNDDQSCWGLAAMTAAEVGFAKPKDAEWVDYAANVWNTQAQRFDLENSTCGGGLRWQIYSFNDGYEYKNAWSNGNFFLLSARLAKFTGNATYAQYADTVYKWSQTVGLVTKDFKVYDGTDASENCTEIQNVRFSATHGIYTEGAALMYNMTGAQNWTDAVKGFVSSSSVFHPNDTSILVETACENNGKCTTDHRAYKGVFARTFARAALAAPVVADSINKILSASAKAAAADCSGGNDPWCSLAWADPDSMWESASATEGNLGEVFNALEVVQGLLYPSAKGLKSAKVAGATAGNSTQNGGASTTSGVGAPQHTGAAGSVVASLTAVLAVALAAMLSL